ncbi:MAG: hypothetical protein GXO75_15460 [Calditrichaeota bacterium]|nr:hypothetical protein [Calditrichota bacterium]
MFVERVSKDLKDFTREELSEIETRALTLASIEGLNWAWQRAYLELADACNKLDAMIARSSAVRTSIDEVEELGK